MRSKLGWETITEAKVISSSPVRSVCHLSLTPWPALLLMSPCSLPFLGFPLNLQLLFLQLPTQHPEALPLTFREGRSQWSELFAFPLVCLSARQLGICFLQGFGHRPWWRPLTRYFSPAFIFLYCKMWESTIDLMT